MSLVRSRDNRTGITYVYESESYWDKEKKQPRAKRKLIGKIDEETGEIVPTDGRGRKRKNVQKKQDSTTKVESGGPSGYVLQLQKKDAQITQLETENQQLRKRLDAILSELSSIQKRYNTTEQ